MGKPANLIGETFGDLKVIGIGKRKVWPKCGGSARAWLCLCTCGDTIEETTSCLRRWRRDCGCKNFTREISKGSRPQNTAYKTLWARMKNAARDRELEWKISFEEFLKVLKGNCVWCGIPPSESHNPYRSKNGNTKLKHKTFALSQSDIVYNGIDRINNSIGYVSGNCQPCCKYCNWARRDRTPEEFLTWLRKAYTYNFGVGL